MNIERLKELVRMGRQIPAHQLDLSEWVTEPSSMKSVVATDQRALLECGTVCCMVGWACSHKPFMEQGLVFSESRTPFYSGDYGWLAVRGFFGLTEGQARHLFDKDSYRHNPTATTVIGRIYKLIREHNNG